jgi:hypothetical protein
MKNSFLFLSLILIGFACKPTVLPTVYITTPKGMSWHEKKECIVTYVDQHDSLVLHGAIKYRGGMSSRYAKHSYALRLNQKFALAGLPKDDDWILNANYIDKTFLRHTLSYDLFRLFDDENIAAKCAYTRLIVNQKMKGLYVVMEELDASTLMLDKKDSMAMIFKDPPIFYKNKDKFDTVNVYRQKFPDIRSSNKTGYLQAFEQVLFEAHDTVFAKNIFQWVDKKSIMDWHLLLLLSNNGDGLFKNWFLYKKNSQEPFKIAVWDYDHSYGRDGDNELNMLTRPIDCQKIILFERLMNNKLLTYPKELQARWHQLRDQQSISYSHIVDLMNENLQMIEQGKEENFKKWPVDSKWYYDANDFGQEITLMKQFLTLRIQQLDARFVYE